MAKNTIYGLSVAKRWTVTSEMEFLEQNCGVILPGGLFVHQSGKKIETERAFCSHNFVCLWMPPKSFRLDGTCILFDRAGIMIYDSSEGIGNWI